MVESLLMCLSFPFIVSFAPPRPLDHHGPVQAFGGPVLRNFPERPITGSRAPPRRSPVPMPPPIIMDLRPGATGTTLGPRPGQVPDEPRHFFGGRSPRSRSFAMVRNQDLPVPDTAVHHIPGEPSVPGHCPQHHPAWPPPGHTWHKNSLPKICSFSIYILGRQEHG